METEECQLFRDEAFLAKNTLNSTTALEYFYSSQFYDASCLNQKRRRGQPCGPKDPGVEYVLLKRPAASRALAESQPNQFGVFIIQKIRRDEHETETPLECYYIIGGSVLRAPSLSALINARLHAAFKQVARIVQQVETQGGWSVLDGFTWVTPTAGEEDEANGGGKRSAPSLDQEIFAKRRCLEIDMVLKQAFDEIAASCLAFNGKLNQIRATWLSEDERWQSSQWEAVQRRVDEEVAAAIKQQPPAQQTDQPAEQRAEQPAQQADEPTNNQPPPPPAAQPEMEDDAASS